jgi:histone deacetylase 11
VKQRGVWKGWTWIGLGVVLAVVVGFFALATAPARAPEARAGKVLPGGIAVVWSPGYRVSFFGIERFHPFDVGKNDTIAKALFEEGLLGQDDVWIPEEATVEQLAQVHAPAYLESLKDPAVLSEALEISVPGFLGSGPIDKRVLAPMRRQAGGTVLAAKLALEHGVAVNVGGGFHHAKPDHGGGFCVYNDVALAIHELRKGGFAGKILIVDTDVHQGDGNNAFFTADPDVITFDISQEEIYPQPRTPSDVDVDLPEGTRDNELLEPVGYRIDRFLREDRPALVIHVAGADVLADDPLGGFSVTSDGLVRRDVLVQRLAHAEKIPLVHVLAGGYGPSAAKAQASSVAAMIREASSPKE